MHEIGLRNFHANTEHGEGYENSGAVANKRSVVFFSNVVRFFQKKQILSITWLKTAPWFRE